MNSIIPFCNPQSKSPRLATLTVATAILAELMHYCTPWEILIGAQLANA
jgi:hypothetical protein